MLIYSLYMHGDLKNNGYKMYSKKKVKIFDYDSTTARRTFRIVGALDPTF